MAPFSPTAAAYTVFFAQCEGKGSVYVATEAAERGQKVRCGVPTSGLVYSGTDEAQSVTITPSDDVKEWTIAILDGDHNA
ncbi:hypothetical protein [Streptomyces sp. 2A115]|uniref:hypothetical protein n=1 Tax=Streptomyces sp. 2A115 TaxID=3457439 RepID=UPI003FD1D6BA